MLHNIKFLLFPQNKYIFKEVMVLALPVIISNLSRVFMHITDTAMVGLLGKNSLVAVAMSGMMIWIAISIGIGLRISAQSVVARRLGENKLDQCGVAMRNAQVMCFFIAFPVSLIGYYFSDYIVPLVVSDSEVIPLCINYFSLVSLSVYFSTASFVFQGFYTGIEKTKVLMYVTISSNLINVYFNAALIYGSENINNFFNSSNMEFLKYLWIWYEFPEMGVKGAAYATLLSSFIMFAFYFIYLFREEVRDKYKVFNLKIDIAMMKRQFSIGYPQSISEILLNLSFLMFYTIMGIIGTVQLAATQVVFAVAHASFLPAVGVGQACSTLVGKYLGKDEVRKATDSIYEGLRGAFIFMGSMGIVFILFPHYLIPLFTSDIEVIKVGVNILRFLGLLQFIDAIAITLWFALAGAGDTRFTAIMGVVASWGIFVPLSYLLGIVLKFGIWGPWLAFAAYLIFEVIVIIFRFKQGKWKHIKL